MSIKKHYLKSKPKHCKVTFKISKSAAKGAKKITIAGDFNNWSHTKNPMKKLKNGDFTAVIALSTDQSEYQFRYLLDNTQWENDSAADAYVPNDIDGDNSVIKV